MALVLLTLCVSFFASADIDIVPIDPLKVAGALAADEVSSYEGYFYSTWVATDGKQYPFNGQFTMRAGIKIEDLTVNDKPWPEEVDGVPAPFGKGQLRFFSVYLYGLNSWGQYIQHGLFYKDLMLEKDGILVEMIPYGHSEFIRYKIEKPGNYVMRIQGQSWNCPYDAVRGGFNFWMEPWWEGLSYEIINTETGEVVEVGVIGEEKEEDSEALVNVSYFAGVENLFPRSHDSFTWPNQWFNSITEEGAVAIYFGNLAGQACNLQIYGDNQPVRLHLHVVAKSEGKDVILYDDTAEDPYCHVLSGYDGIVVTVLLDPKGEVPSSTFSVSATRWWEGGGKG